MNFYGYFNKLPKPFTIFTLITVISVTFTWQPFFPFKETKRQVFNSQSELETPSERYREKHRNNKREWANPNEGVAIHYNIRETSTIATVAYYFCITSHQWVVKINTSTSWSQWTTASTAQPSYLSSTRITFTPAKMAPGDSALLAAHKPRAPRR